MPKVLEVAFSEMFESKIFQTCSYRFLHPNYLFQLSFQLFPCNKPVRYLFSYYQEKRSGLQMNDYDFNYHSSEKFKIIIIIIFCYSPKHCFRLIEGQQKISIEPDVPQ